MTDDDRSVYATLKREDWAELARRLTAVGLEVSFGRPLDGDDEPLAREAPVEIALGAGLTRPPGSA